MWNRSRVFRYNKVKLRNQEQKIQNEINRQNNTPIHNDSTKNKHNTQFYAILVNNTNITLTEPETKLLEKRTKI
jgi:ornithine carbamoyltransferase